MKPCISYLYDFLKGLLHTQGPFLHFKGQPQQIELKSVEIREEGTFLHPADDPEHTFLVKAKEIEILINPDAELSEDDILVLDNNPKPTEAEPLETDSVTSDNVPNESYAQESAPVQDNDRDQSSSNYHAESFDPKPLSNFLPTKKRFSVMLYQDEYESLMNNIKANGYKKVEYFLACMESAKKQSMMSVYKRYTTEHEKRRKLDLNAAKRAQTEDFMSRSTASEQTQI